MKIGLLGASRVARYAVIEPARLIGGVEVLAIAARSMDSARTFAGTHGIARHYGDYDSLIADADIDLVYIGTPPGTHAALANKAIETGKAVLVEKPFALDGAEASQVFQAAQSAGVAVFEAMHSPHHRVFHRLLEIVHGGDIGRVTRIVGEFDAPIDVDDPFRWDAALGGGALMDLGVYPLAWLRRLAGEDFDVPSATAEWRNGVDQSFTANLRFASGVVAEVRSSMAAKDVRARLLVEGEKGEIELINPVSPQKGHSLRVTNGGGTWTATVDGPGSYEAQLIAVRDALDGTAPFPFPDDDYVRSMDAIDKVRAAFGRPG